MGSRWRWRWRPARRKEVALIKRVYIEGAACGLAEGARRVTSEIAQLAPRDGSGSRDGRHLRWWWAVGGVGGRDLHGGSGKARQARVQVGAACGAAEGVWRATIETAQLAP